MRMFPVSPKLRVPNNGHVPDQLSRSQTLGIVFVRYEVLGKRRKVWVSQPNDFWWTQRAKPGRRVAVWLYWDVLDLWLCWLCWLCGW